MSTMSPRNTYSIRAELDTGIMVWRGTAQSDRANGRLPYTQASHLAYSVRILLAVKTSELALNRDTIRNMRRHGVFQELLSSMSDVEITHTEPFLANGLRNLSRQMVALVMSSMMGNCGSVRILRHWWTRVSYLLRYCGAICLSAGNQNAGVRMIHPVIKRIVQFRSVSSVWICLLFNQSCTSYFTLL